jgi:hypothetical protein
MGVQSQGMFPFVTQKPSWAPGLPHVLEEMHWKGRIDPSRKVTDEALGAGKGPAE